MEVSKIFYTTGITCLGLPDVEPWTGEIEAFLNRTPNGLEYKIIARKTFRNKDGLIVIDNKADEGDIVVSYNAAILEQLVEKGKLSKEIGDPLIEDLDEIESSMLEFRKFLEENPQASEEEKREKFGQLNKHNSEKLDSEKHKKRTLSVRYLISLKHIIDEEREAAKMLPLFRKNLRPGEDFGVTKAVADRLVYLPELLDGAKLTHVDGDHYLIRAELPANSVGLEYSFIAPDKSTADQIFECYREEMEEDALKVLLGFWILANDKGMFDYTAEISDVMTRISDCARESYFSVKEKKRFWALAKLLENTKLTLIIPYKEGRSKEKKLTVEHRLIEISARDSDKSDEADEYPTRIKARVLNYEEFGGKAQLATAIANGTARLPPQDIMLALSLQARASQRRKEGEFKYDETYLIEKAHLQKTSEANPRVARQRLKGKLNAFTREKIVDDWSKTDDQYRFLRKFDESNQPKNDD